jgi:Tol biopolymer transport system component
MIWLVSACSDSAIEPSSPADHLEVPQAERWGIYRLDLATQEVALVYSSLSQISFLDLNNGGYRFVYSQVVGGDSDSQEEIFSLDTDGTNLTQLTNNDFRDLYPVWSPDDETIAFLSWRNDSLGIFVMNSDGSQQQALLDSDSHEADIDWVGDLIAYTLDSRIWIMGADGSDARPITNPPRAGEWGEVNLPFGDYDPRISPDGSMIVFERLIGDQSPHGEYDLFVVDLATLDETRLTSSGYSQGLASWSHFGEQLVYIVSAIGETGMYDIYTIKADGTTDQNITPDYFPQRFLCHWAIFSSDDTAIYFIGEWWE